jgi:hypothetical protein
MHGGAVTLSWEGGVCGEESRDERFRWCSQLGRRFGSGSETRNSKLSSKISKINLSKFSSKISSKFSSKISSKFSSEISKI